MEKKNNDLKIKEVFKKQIKEKMQVILNNDLENIPSSALPETFSIDYYFISYSHKDYKEVYYDIFRLQLEGMNIWYDRGIPAGKDWKEVAQRNITPFECKGVILYISENSLMSDAVIDEIKYVQEVGKQFVCITLPFISDYLYKNESIKGKYFSILEMIEILKENNAISGTKAKELKKLFNEETIFLPYKTLSSNKVEKIRLFTPTIPLLNGEMEEFPAEDDAYMLIINSIRDHLVNKITKQDFYDLINKLEGSTKSHYLVVFEKTSLANCYYLEKIETASNIEITQVGEYAFANDTKFKGFGPKKLVECSADAGAFYNCASLRNDFTINYGGVGNDAFMGCQLIKNVDLTYCLEDFIGEGAFSGCKKMEKIIIPEKIKNIGKRAFNGCESLIEITLPEDIKEIKKATFSGCSSLRKVKMSDSVYEIGDSAFRGCKLLSDIVLSNNIVHIGVGAFQFCDNLKCTVYENVKYLGTKDNPYFLAVSLNERFIKVTKFHEQCHIINSYAFKNCSRLYGKIVIPNQVIQIGKGAFVRNDGLYEIELPDLLTVLEESVFEECTRLRSIKMGQRVTYIGESAFDGCEILASIIVPVSVGYIGPHAFANCPKLKAITFLGTKEEWHNALRNSVSKYSNTESLSNDYQYIKTIHCKDGDIKDFSPLLYLK